MLGQIPEGAARKGMIAGVLGLAGGGALIAWLYFQGTSGEQPRHLDSQHNQLANGTSAPAKKEKNPDKGKQKPVITQIPSPVPNKVKSLRVHTQEELQKRFDSDIQELNRIVERYKEEQARLFAEHPELPALKTWIHKSHEDHYETNKDRLNSITAFNSEHPETLQLQRDLMKLKMPEAILAVMTDGQFAPWFAGAFEVAGLKNSIGADLKEWDKQAGYKAASSDEYLIESVAELQAAFAARALQYQRAYSYQASNSGLPQFLIEQLPLDVRYEQFRRTAKLYLESFYGGPLERLRADFNTLTARMNSLYPWGEPFARQWQSEFQKAALAYGDAGKK